MTLDEFRQRFVNEELVAQLQRSSAAIKDYKFDPIKFLPKGLKLLYQEPVFHEQPPAGGYQFFLQSEVAQNACNSSVQGEIFFALNPSHTLDLLFLLANKFERFMPDKIVRSDQVAKIGSFGLHWQWIDKGGKTEALFFMRHNAVVGLYGACLVSDLPTIGLDIDNSLAKTPTSPSYSENKQLLTKLKSKKIPATTRLDLGELGGDSTHFFMTTSGSVNRDIEHPEQWYYRAGSEKGPQTITIIQLANGNTPKIEYVTIEVV